MARILITNPEIGNGSGGNTTTSLRWARLLRGLNHRVTVGNELPPRGVDLLIALHAHRSADIVAGYRAARPDAPLIVTLTGTDLYRDLPGKKKTLKSLVAADRIVALHPLANQSLPRKLRRKTTVIYQSVRMPKVPLSRRPRHFTVAVIANLRRVKDPLRAAYAAGKLPEDSRIRVVHAGRILEGGFRERVRREMKRNPRYAWRGELPGGRAKRLLAGSRLLVMSSLMEGGANVVSEAIVAGVPVLASRIPGNIGLLGTGYPGYYDVGDTKALTRLMLRAERDRSFYRSLQREIRDLQPLFRPARERESWKRLLEEILG